MPAASSSDLIPRRGTSFITTRDGAPARALCLIAHFCSCGDYASGTNHTLPTNGYARQFSGVNTLSFQKHITSQEVTAEGLKDLGPIVATLADCEGLDAHANAVRIRLRALAQE